MEKKERTQPEQLLPTSQELCWWPVQTWGEVEADPCGDSELSLSRKETWGTALPLKPSWSVPASQKAGPPAGMPAKADTRLLQLILVFSNWFVSEHKRYTQKSLPFLKIHKSAVQHWEGHRERVTKTETADVWPPEGKAFPLTTAKGVKLPFNPEAQIHPGKQRGKKSSVIWDGLAPTPTSDACYSNLTSLSLSFPFSKVGWQ